MRLILAAATVAATAGPAAATITYDTNVTPNVQLLYGTGNANEAFTADRANGIEVGLRGKLRYGPSGTPLAVYNSDGNGLYEFDPSDGVAPSNRSLFSFDWSVNVDYDGSTAKFLDDFSYLLEIDFDPSAAVGTVEGVDLVSFDPISVGTPSAWDHGLGTNASTSPTVSKQYVATDFGGGLGLTYAQAVEARSVAQNSWNLGFFNPSGFIPQTEGLYTITLSVFGDGVTPLASSSIDIRYGDVPQPVPVPAALPLMGAGLAALAFLARRRRA
ncbi:MAG: PEP-CTERM sorting domain-containing protein [Albimonas sp.]|uniref:PEP-CTERM sorting domain-containing protein n=1 Tax=Albimonas sp. TaxID=1872425 RepID=UPI0040579001|tara:strand:+ start:193 stop:1008 length:816 start_codon:yes stop_codon:yes gene_type:complete